MGIPIDARIAALAAAQHGVVAYRQLVALGLSRRAVAHRSRSGRLHSVHRGVYAFGLRRLSQHGRWMAEVLACGEAAVLSHTDAAALHELRATRAVRVHVTVPTSAGVRQRRGIVVHRSRRLSPAQVTTQAGIAVTTVARTLLDCAGMLAPTRLERAVEQSLATRAFDLVEVRAVLAANATRPGATTLEAIVHDLHEEPQLAAVELERLFLDLCAARAIPRPAVNVDVGEYRVDFLWRAQRLIAETDGNEQHGTRAAFERDRARDASLTVAGYRVLRFTHRQVVHDPSFVASTLLALLR